MPIISDGIENRCISEQAPTPPGWAILRELADADLLPIAKEMLKNKIIVEAERRCSVVYGTNYTLADYQKTRDILLSLPGPMTLQPRLARIKAIADKAQAAIDSLPGKDIGQMDAYSITIDPGWPE